MAFSGAFTRPFRPAFDAGLAAAGNGLLNNLVAYWTLDETSGNRADSSGNGYTLAPTGSPGYRAGKLGNAVDIPNDSNILRITNNALRLVAGTSKSWSLWAYSDTFPATDTFPLARWAGTGDWGFVLNSTGIAGLLIAALTQAEALTPSGTVTTGIWYHLCGWFDHSVGTYGTAYFCLNNGTVYSAALVNAHTSADGVQMAVGRLGSNTYYGDYDGAVDEVGIWSAVLTAAQRTALYNAGAGLAYAAFTT